MSERCEAHESTTYGYGWMSWRCTADATPDGAAGYCGQHGAMISLARKLADIGGDSGMSDHDLALAIGIARDEPKVAA